MKIKHQIWKGKTMKNTFSLNARIDELLKKKSSNCECNPCNCPELTKDQYFKELKDILKRFNIAKFASYSLKNVNEKLFYDKF